MADERAKKPIYKVERVVDIATKPLAELLDEFLPEQQNIDFLTIDVEGLDFQVLRSNNWEKYSPKIILLENEMEIQEMIGSDIDIFMQEKLSTLCQNSKNFFLQASKLSDELKLEL
jgi:hypothetical protein